MFLVSEPIAWGMEHVPFNSAFLRTIRLAYPDDTICFYAEEAHSEHVREQIGEEFAASIIWKKLTLPLRHSSFYARLSKDFRTVKFLLDQLNENPQDHVLVLTFGNPSLLWALKFYVCTVYKNKRIQVVLHEEFSKLRYRGSLKDHLNPFYHMGSLKTALRFACDDCIQYIVLEEAVRDAVIKELPFLQNSINVLDHPIPTDEVFDEHINFTRPIQFGYLGRATEEKGFLKYLTVASEISKRYPGLANFQFIGRIIDNNNFNTPEISFLSEKPGTNRLTRNEYINRLKNLHFVCLFYDKYYEFTASGVLMDCIAWGKPIIATTLPIFENLMKKYGDIGYLSQNGEINEVISNILEKNDLDRYNHQVLNMRKARISRTHEALSREYREIVEKRPNI